MVLWFRRIKRLFQYKRQTEDIPSKDPVAMADELLKDMANELDNTKQSLNKQIAAEKRLERRLGEAQAESADREKDAVRFLSQDDEHSARLALMKKNEADRHIQEIESLYESAKTHKQDILRHIEEQNNDYDKLQVKKHELQSKRNLPPSSSVKEIEAAKTHVADGAVRNREAHVSHMPAADQGQSNETLQPDADVDDRLEELKQSLRKGN